MKDQKEKIDAYIKEALSADQEKFYETLEEQSMVEMIGGLYQGKMKWLNIGSIIISLIVIAIAVYCLMNFLDAETTKEQLQWGMWFILCTMTSSMLKIWAWQQMNKNEILREIKRLELTIAHLSEKSK